MTETALQAGYIRSFNLLQIVPGTATREEITQHAVKLRMMLHAGGIGDWAEMLRTALADCEYRLTRLTAEGNMR